MSPKSPEAFRTISEVSKDLSLPQHVLRFWETKFAQIKPIKRGGGRRYYRPEDVKLLKGIKSLLYNDGYTIRGVQKVIKQNGTKNILLNENQNNNFTEIENDNMSHNNHSEVSNHNLSEIKRKKLMNVMNDLVMLKKKLEQDK
jgi:DNA-binding transcriptional MerR regulator